MKRTIYIVDDQPEVLETAVFMVKSFVAESEVTGFTDSRLALAAVKTNPPDLILSDHLMPEMRGSELLEAVRLASPGTLRIIMSGYVALDKLTSITSAHQYVAKPFDAVRLKELLRRTFAAQGRIADNGLKTVVTSIHSLPSLPQVHQSLLAELEDSSGASAIIGQMVSQDAGLSIKVLHLANSPLFGRDYLVSSPAEAVLCLGTSMILAVVLAQSLFQHFRQSAHPALSLPRVWNHCWETATLAQAYCREQGLPRDVREEAFLAGLLHETGRLILMDNFPDKFLAACDDALRAKLPLEPQLREAFQATSAQVGTYLLDLWGMPDTVVTAVSNLDHPEKAKTSGFSLTSALYIADAIASRSHSPDPCTPAAWNPAYVRSLGCPDTIKSWERKDHRESGTQ
jgi:HD-like signal output (HDOD) protein